MFCVVALVGYAIKLAFVKVMLQPVSNKLHLHRSESGNELA
jgi:hypothetical protein